MRRSAAAVLVALAVAAVLGGSVARPVSAKGVATATLPKAVAAPSCSGTTPIVCEIGVTEGLTGFPITVTEAGAAAQSGTVPAGDYVAVSVGGTQLDNYQAANDGSFTLPVPAGVIPAGSAAIVTWSPSPSAIMPPSVAGQQVEYLARSQRPDGAVLEAPGLPGTINPYVADLAAIGLAESNTPEADAEVSGWIQWYFRHLNGTDKYGLTTLCTTTA